LVTEDWKPVGSGDIIYFIILSLI